ncbi:MAG TPA: hypothetical protein DEP28_01715 [Bacteroidetes bacterium]|nr:hypothetical protein [Bacteroidota bacterium]HCN36695.1 hypothetical protein [Bacteroidota bacterium]
MTLFFIILALVTTLIHLAVKKAFKDEPKRIEIILLNFIVVIIGGSSLLAAAGHLLIPDQIAESIGWPTGSPFQTEVGLANLGFGIAAVMGIWFRKTFWLSTIISSGVFLFGDGVGHVYQMIAHGDYAENNAGIIMYTDFLIPIAGLILYSRYNKSLKNG